MSCNDDVLVSVCVPVYNCQQFIAQTISSILAQTYTNFELVIVDDKSTDSTLDVIQRFDDPRIRLLQNENNLGYEGNYNKAILASRGKYVKLLSADDLAYPDCISKQVAILEDPRYVGVQLVTSHRDVIDPDGKKLLVRKCPLGPGVVAGRTAIKRCVRGGTNLIGEQSVTLIRKDILEKSGLFSEKNRYVIDLDLFARILQFGDLFVIPESLSAFRLNTISMSWNDRNCQADSFRRFISDTCSQAIHPISPTDRMSGWILAGVNALGRQLFYKIFLHA